MNPYKILLCIINIDQSSQLTKEGLWKRSEQTAQGGRFAQPSVHFPSADSSKTSTAHYPTPSTSAETAFPIFTIATSFVCFHS